MAKAHFHAMRPTHVLRRLGGPATLVLALLAAPVASAAVQWEEAQAEAGVLFDHAGEVHPDQLAPDWPAFPEIMGGGACWGDYDGDGTQDLYLVNQQYNDENPGADDVWFVTADPRNQLFLNDGDGTFTDVTDDAGVASRTFSFGCSAADYDADGDLDLFVGGWDVTELYRNEGDGTFTEVSEAAGVDKAGTCGDFACFTTSSAWADYDRDGDLDLYVLNYVETDMLDSDRGPNFHVGQVNWLFRNEGDGTFTEVADAAGVAGLPADENGSKSLGVVWFDCELDGDLDLLVANDEVPLDFYRNNGDGTFTEDDEVGLLDNRANMGVGAADYDGDGYPDLFITHYQAELDGFYHNRGDCTFEDRSGEDDMINAADLVGWGTAFVDWDRDMDLDLMSVYGHTESILDYQQPMIVLRQDPNPDPGALPWDKEWVEVTADAGAGPNVQRVHRGAAWADYDLDGDVDLALVNNNNESAQLLRASGNTGHWLRLELVQAGMNRAGIGARVTLEAGGVAQVREVQTGTSYLSQNDLALDFGLGANTEADRITVEWPAGGADTILEAVPADRVVRLDRDTATYVTDTLSPLTAIHVDGVPGLDGWWRSPVAVTLTAADRAVGPTSGVAATEYALDASPWTPNAGGPIPVADAGIHALRARSVDAVGNVEPVRERTVRIDETPPVVDPVVEGQPGLAGWFVGPDVTVDLRAADDVSGVGEVRFRLDGGAWTVFDAPLVIDADGVHTIDYAARDRAGNEAAPGALEVRLDGTAPDAALVRPARGHVYLGSADVADLRVGPAVIVATSPVAGAGGDRFPVDVDAADATSGLDHVQILLNGSVVADLDSAPFAWAWDTAAYPAGSYALAARAFDAAGNDRVAALTVALASATPGGLERTIEEGPSTEIGGDPLEAPHVRPVALWAAPEGVRVQ